jgi:hypothetical protein
MATKVLQVAEPAGIVAGKNVVINGGMDIWQRGTSISIAASTSPSVGTYGPDRWQSSGTNASQAMTISRQATGDSTNLPNIQYCMRYQRNSGQTGTGYTGVTQSIETVNSIPYAGKTVNFSFYARAGANYSTSANALYMQLKTGTGTDQNVNGPFTGDAAPINGQVTLTTIWQRFTFSVAIPTGVTQLGANFVANFTGTAGAADYFEVTGVQVELGNIATPFSRNSGTIQSELAACQRYYFRISTTSGTAWFGQGITQTTSLAYALVTFQNVMRVRPTTIDYLGTKWWIPSGSGVVTPTLQESSPFSILLNLAGSSMPTGGSVINLIGTDSTSYLGLSAEL